MIALNTLAFQYILTFSMLYTLKYGENNMKIEIKKKGNRTAILITFHTQSEKFKSPSERNKFFAELYGRKQIIPKENKKYIYRREGLLDTMNHIKVDNSVFIVALEQMKRMEKFFKEWEDKVMVKTFPVLINENQAEKLEEGTEVKIE